MTEETVWPINMPSAKQIVESVNSPDVVDHLRACAENGDMPTIDAEDAKNIVEFIDLLTMRVSLIDALPPCGK